MGRLRKSHGIQAEVLLSLAVVMITATALLAAFFLQTHSRQIDRLRSLLGRALIAEARAASADENARSPGADWWNVSRSGVATAQAAVGSAIDAESLALAETARQSGVPQLRAGAPWQPIRFAVTLDGAGTVAVARLPAAVSGGIALALLLVDAAVFTALGASLLRRRVVVPLRRIASAAHRLSEGESETRAQVEGIREVEELARAFNQMSQALEARTGSLEKAVTDLRESNRRLRTARAGIERAERLAAVGRLAAGVAHEVGNPMGALLAFLDLAGRDPGLSADGRGHLTRASAQGQRVRSILRQLLDFSRPPRAEAVALDVGPVAEQVVDLLRAQERYQHVDFVVARETSTPPALADEGMVVQILLNLVENAADAACEGSKPRVWVAVRSGPLGAREADGDAGASDRWHADAVVCEVSDNGAGVAGEDEERIFDPFFTSKPPGQGTGLGLPNALRLAEQQGGTLELAVGGAGVGASFRLRLPAATLSSARGTCVRGA